MDHKGDIMKYILDQDYHIHSQLSDCSSDPEQTAAKILKYAEDNDFKEICITDHFWDSHVPGASEWYEPQNFAHISSILPLPQGKNTRFYFGCETEMDKYMNLGISDKSLEFFDLILIPTTHLHMPGFTIEENTLELSKRAVLWAERFAKLLRMDLPFEKIGVPHLTCTLMSETHFEGHIQLIDLIEDATFHELFKKAAKLGVGIELNLPVEKYSAEQFDRIMRPYKVAKLEGCKFYMGSDAHHPGDFVGMKEGFGKMAEYLGLTEEDKFRPFKNKRRKTI